MKTLLKLIVAGLLTCGFTTTAIAQGGVATEIATAHTHAMFAQKAGSVDATHLHLHHVVNCLVGTDGAAFNADAGNPCKGQGNGALPDSANNQALHNKLKQVLSTAEAGLDADSVDAAHAKASKVANMLQNATAQK